MKAPDGGAGRPATPGDGRAARQRKDEMKLRRTRTDSQGGTVNFGRGRGYFGRLRGRRFFTLILISLALIDCAAAVVSAQTPSPSPTPSAQGSAPQQQVRNLSDIAVRFVPAVKRTVEGAMLRRYTFLATVFAQIVMLAAFIKLQADKPGATRDFFG